MKEQFAHIGLARLCGWFGITRQAYYQHGWNSMDTAIEHTLVLQKVTEIRTDHRRMGTRKLFVMLEPFLIEHQIKLGRDALFDLLSANGLLVRRTGRRIRTTHSFHWLHKYPNLIKGFEPAAPNELWVSDITYWKIATGDHVYISFITDAYSHRIVGYHAAQTLEAVESARALQMALSAFDGQKHHWKLIHHSDRGIQYCSHAYVKLLEDHGIQISMTQSGDPLENAIAERLNGIIKEEYLAHYKVYDMTRAKELLQKAVHLYNDQRPHMSNGNFTPDHIHQSSIKTQKTWKNYYRKNPNIVDQQQNPKQTVNPLQD